MTLAEVLEAAALEVGADMPASADNGRAWSRTGVLFAWLSGDGATAEFLLDPAVAAASTRTPDTRPSERGPGWVRFTPSSLDGHAADRAKAWFQSAHRRLATG